MISSAGVERQKLSGDQRKWRDASANQPGTAAPNRSITAAP